MFTNQSSTTNAASKFIDVKFDSCPLCALEAKPVYLSSDNYGRTKIHYAAMKGCIKNLYWDTSSINLYLDQPDCCARSALHYAAIKGDVKEVQILLTLGSNPNLADIHGYIPMHYAAEGGHISVAQELIEHKSNIYSQTRVGGMTPLHLAALNGHEKIEELLLNSDPQIINQADNSGGTALHFASLMGYLSIVKLLIARNADINSLTSNDKTPLNYADNFEEIKNMLCEHGALLGQGIPDPKDPIHLAEPSSNEDYIEEDLMVGDIYDYFKAE